MPQDHRSKLPCPVSIIITQGAQPRRRQRENFLVRPVSLHRAAEKKRLSRGHGLGHEALEGELLLLEVLGGAVVELEGTHGVADGALNLLLLATLELEGEGRVGDDLLDTADVGLELLLGLELLAEGLVVALESLGVC
jgi:hypothetical protein